jgi:hypothetical protein
MKTIPCPTCGRQISRNAASCPACGHRGPFGRRKVFQLVINVLGIVAVLVLVLLILMFAGF